MAHTGTMDLGRNVQAKPSGNPWQVIGLAIAAVATVATVWFASSAGRVGTQVATKPQGANVPVLADHRYDAIEAQRGTIALSTDTSYNDIEKLRGNLPSVITSGMLTGKAADDIALGRNSGYDAIETQRGLFAGGTSACRAISPTTGFTLNVSCFAPSAIAPSVTLVEPALEAKAARVLALAKAEAQADVAPLPYLYAAGTSSPSGTFHAGNPSVQLQNEFAAQHDLSSGAIVLLPGVQTIDNPVKRDRVGGP